MEGTRRTMMLVMALAFLAVSLAPMASTDAAENKVLLVDSQGNVVEGSTALIGKQLVFETYTANGQTTFLLEKGTEISVPDRYLRIDGPSGAFLASAVIPDSGITGTLRDAGLVIRLTADQEIIEATLTTANGFSDSFKHDDGSAAGLETGQMYKITILTAEDITGRASVEKTDAFSIQFYLEKGCLVSFYDGSTLYESIAVEKGGRITDIPQLEDRGDYQFMGWYDSNGRQFTEYTVVNADMTLRAKWHQVQPDPEPEEDVERHTEIIINDDGTVTVEETEIITRKDGSSTETVTSTTENLDGTETVVVEEVDTDPIGNQRTTDCSVVKTWNDDGTETSD